MSAIEYSLKDIKTHRKQRFEAVDCGQLHHFVGLWPKDLARFVLKSITCFFVFNFFCVSCAIIVFSKFSWGLFELPSGKHTKNYGKSPSIVDLPMNNGDVP